MKIFQIIILIMLSAFCNTVKAQIADNFEEEGLSNRPHWNGDTTLFILNTGRLQSNGNQASSTIYLSTPQSMLDNAEWNFKVFLQFKASSTNYVRIYLTSNKSDLKGILNGYYLQIGQSTHNRLQIFKQEQNKSTSVFEGNTYYDGSILNLQIKILRDSTGFWNIFADTSCKSTFHTEGSFTDTSFKATNYFGVYCKYSTASRYNMYAFDDIYVGKIRHDTTPPSVMSIKTKDCRNIQIVFSEPIDSISAHDKNNYFINDLNIEQLDFIDNRTINLHFSDSFECNFSYELFIENITDKTGNQMHPFSYEFQRYCAFTANENEVLFNEILFDAKSDGIEFVEILNNSNHPINLNQIGFGKLDSKNQIKPLIFLSNDSNDLWESQQLIILTKDAVLLQSLYTICPQSKVLELSNFPTLNNDVGTLVLCAKDSAVLDRFDYNKTMHYALLSDVKGISLERMHTDLPTTQANNWHSASTQAGFATPGCENSQGQKEETATKDAIFTAFPAIFSPDADGYSDVLNLCYQLPAVGYTCQIRIFDSQGRQVKHLANNELLGISGCFTWDGLDENKHRLPLGVYIVWIELFNTRGQVIHIRKSIVIATNK